MLQVTKKALRFSVYLLWPSYSACYFCFALLFLVNEISFKLKYLFLATHCSHNLHQFTSVNARIVISKIFQNLICY